MDKESLVNQIVDVIKNGDLEKFQNLLNELDNANLDANLDVTPNLNLGFLVCLQNHKNASKMLDMLFSKNLNPYSKDPLGKTLIERIIDKFAVNNNLLEFIKVLQKHKVSFLHGSNSESPINMLLDETKIEFSKDLVMQAFNLIAKNEPEVLKELSEEKTYDLLHIAMVSNSPHSVDTFKILLRKISEETEDNALGKELMEHTVHHTNQYTSLFIEALIIDANVDPNFVCDDDGEWLIIKCIKSRSEYSVDIVETLLRNNAWVIQSDGISALYTALELNEEPYFEEMYQVLFDHCQRDIIESFLFQVVTYNIKNVDKIIAKAIDNFAISPDLNIDNKSILYTVISNLHSNSLPVLSALLERGANPNLNTSNLSIISLVLEKTYDVMSIEYNEGEKILDLLIGKGADLDKISDTTLANQVISNITPLMTILNISPLEEDLVNSLHRCVIKLVDSGANLATKSQENANCFHFLSAISSNNPRLSKANAEYILDNVGDINDLNVIYDFNLSPAACAISMKDYHTLGLLYESGADMNAAGANNRTPLAIAMFNQDFFAISLLISMGANPYNPIDDQGNNLFQSVYGEEVKNMYSRLNYIDILIRDFFRFFNLANRKYSLLTNCSKISQVVFNCITLDIILKSIRFIESKVILFPQHQQAEFNGSLLMKIESLIDMLGDKLQETDYEPESQIPKIEIQDYPEFIAAEKAANNIIEYLNKIFNIIENEEINETEFPDSINIQTIRNSLELSKEQKESQISKIKMRAYFKIMLNTTRFLECNLDILYSAVDAREINDGILPEVGNTLLNLSNYLLILGDSFDEISFKLKRSAANLGDTQSKMILSNFKHNSKRASDEIVHDESEAYSITSSTKKRRI